MSQPTVSGAGANIRFEQNRTNWPPEIGADRALVSGHLRFFHDGARFDLRVRVARDERGTWQLTASDLGGRSTATVALAKAPDGAQRFSFMMDGTRLSGRIEFDSHHKVWMAIFDHSPKYARWALSGVPTQTAVPARPAPGDPGNPGVGNRASFFAIERGARHVEMQRGQSERIWGAGGQEAWRKHSK